MLHLRRCMHMMNRALMMLLLVARRLDAVCKTSISIYWQPRARPAAAHPVIGLHQLYVAPSIPDTLRLSSQHQQQVATKTCNLLNDSKQRIGQSSSSSPRPFEPLQHAIPILLIFILRMVSPCHRHFQPLHGISSYCCCRILSASSPIYSSYRIVYGTTSIIALLSSSPAPPI